jgi:diguanylate cyclase (GGDEF)-like protein/PAS domain S-box-containing protein
MSAAERTSPLPADEIAVYESLVAAVLDVSVVATPDGVYRYVSPACRTLLGWAPEELQGRSDADLVHPDDCGSLIDTRDDVTADEEVTTTYRMRRADGSYRWVEAVSREVEVEGACMVVSTLRDIADRREQGAAMERRALTDPLTGVANRTVLIDRLQQGLRRLERGGVLAVLYLDLDRFKVVNDSFGHRVGDAVLLRLAERLTHHLRPSDTLARLGGDEFVIVAEDVDEKSAINLGRRIVTSSRQPFSVDGEDFVCTLSAGIVTTADPGRQAEDLLHDADLALYRAKHRGRDRIEVFDEDLHAHALQRRGMERLLRRAIDEDRVEVAYQPVVELDSGRYVGTEALVRVRDRDHRLLMPDSFLEVARGTGLLHPLTTQVLRKAIEQAMRWQGMLPGLPFASMGVNVSGRQAADVGFHNLVISELDEHGVPHEALQIEVTEQVLMEASSSTLTTLRLLREEGVRVALDSFGTGYSSLTCLRHFPLDVVKIDRTLLEPLATEPGVRAMVGALIDLGHALQLTVVAAGVESACQARLLRDMGCDLAQGFLFGRPALPASAEACLSSGVWAGASAVR